MAIDREPRWVKTDLQKYNHLLDKVRYLRRKGWVIYMDSTGFFMVGTKRLDEAGLTDVWSREKAREQPLNGEG